MTRKLGAVLVVLFIFSSASCNTPPEVPAEVEVQKAIEESPETVETDEPEGIVSSSDDTVQEAELSEEPVSTSDDLTYEVVYEEVFPIFDPYAELFDDDLLASIGADGFSGTDAEIAQMIFDWQKANMHYVSDPSTQVDVSYPGRWNMFLPGIYPASEMVAERVTDDGKFYGICFDYAMIFCAIGNSYGLETRVSYFTTYTFSEAHDWVDPATTRGLSMDEYGALRTKMVAHGLSLSYDQIDRVAREAFIHARAEVKIDGQWVPFDAVPSISGDFLEAENYEALPYTHAYSNILLYAPPAMENDQLDLHALAELLSYSPQVDYEGITDDAGNEHRAATFIDLVRGLGLVPYYRDPEKIIDFLQLPEDEAEEILGDVAEVGQAYEMGTGKPFFAIADFLVYGDQEEMEASEYLFLYNTITGAQLTAEEFDEYIK